MAEKSDNSGGAAGLTAFVTADYYVVGAGETVDEIQASGEWLATVDPADVRR